MGKGQPKSPTAINTGIGIAGFLLRPSNRGWVTTVAVVLASLIGFAISWQKWGAPSLESDEYLVTAEQIQVTPQPNWIHTNVKTECVRSLTGLKLSLLDRDLVEKVANVFTLHPWVAGVIRVEKRYPSQVNVELEYRRPVLVVKIEQPGDEGLLFLDQDAVLLPSTDFAPTQARNYLRIAAAGEAPTSVYGTPWSSDRIAGAAGIADCWGTRWQPLGLYWIVTSKTVGGQLIYELHSQDDKVRVIWGQPPGHEGASEPTAEQKIAALEQLVQEQGGSLEKFASEKPLDLRTLDFAKK